MNRSSSTPKTKAEVPHFGNKPGAKEALVSATEAMAACKAVLASEKFARAPRMRCLLQFLVDAAVSGKTQNTKEFAIGISVFGREASTYYTSEDPAVRVQVGRLREKLKDYYSTAGAKVEILIPLGSYMPTFRRTNSEDSGSPKTLILLQSVGFTEIDYGQSFAHGLQDELLHQLFKFMDEYRIFQFRQLWANGHGSSGPFKPPSAGFFLETCSRVEEKRVRVSVRLMDAINGQIHWSEQFDRKTPPNISLQEELALAICTALKLFFVDNGDIPRSISPDFVSTLAQPWSALPGYSTLPKG